MDKTQKVHVENQVWRYSFAGVGIGVFWAVWSAYGFIWGVIYGIFWQVWVGFRLAVYILQHF